MWYGIYCGQMVYGMVEYDVVWCGQMVWYDIVWCGVEWYSMVRCGYVTVTILYYHTMF